MSTYAVHTIEGDVFVWTGTLPAADDGVVSLPATPILLACASGTLVNLANVTAMIPVP